MRLLVRYSGVCLLVGAGLEGLEHDPAGWRRGWVLTDMYDGGGNCRSVRSRVYHSGPLATDFNLSSWHTLALVADGARYRASVDGVAVFDGVLQFRATADAPSAGLASLRSSYSYSRFDDLRVFQTAPAPRWPNVLFDKHLLAPPSHYPGGGARRPAFRDDFSGEVGCSFTSGMDAIVVAIGRFARPGGGNGTHTLRLVDATTNTTLLASEINLGSDSATGDLNGYVWSNVSARQQSGPRLHRGRKYYLVSGEESGGDYFADSQTMVQSGPGATLGFATPVYRDAKGWHELDDTDHDTGLIGGFCYGPVNLEFRAPG